MAVARRHGVVKIGADRAQMATHQPLPLLVRLQASRDVLAELWLGDAEAAPFQVRLERVRWSDSPEAPLQVTPATPAQVPIFETPLEQQDRDRLAGACRLADAAEARLKLATTLVHWTDTMSAEALVQAVR
jgi:hypothetical protein